MRILTFLNSFEPGGVERVALRLVRRWRELGADAPLYVGRDVGALREELASDLSYFVPRQPGLGSSFWEPVFMMWHLPRHVRLISPDVIFCAGSTYTVVAVWLKIALGRRCPPIVAKISNDLERSDLPRPARAVWRAWLKVQTRFIDRWIVMDAGMLGDVDRSLGDSPRTVIPDPAIDRLPVPRLPAARMEPVRFVFVGRLVGQKDPCTLLSAFAHGAGPTDRLTVIGDGPLRDRLQRQAESLGVADRVRLVGHVPNAAKAMRDHDVLLLSSRYEGVPAVIVEALASGLAIVTTDSGSGVRALVDDGRLARLVPVGDVDAFASAIAKVRFEAVDVEGGRRHAETYTLDVAALRYLETSRRMLVEHRSRASGLRNGSMETTA